MYVQLTSSNVSYDGSNVFQADVTVQNLLEQPMGTPNGALLTGIKVFFHTGPVVTSGTGTVTVANADGIDTFTAANQPFFEYNLILQADEASAAKTWQWSVPSTVETFEFSVYLSTDVPPPVDSLAIWQSDPAIAVHDSVYLQAQLFDTTGGATFREVTWANITDPAGTTIRRRYANSVFVIGEVPGTYSITATSEGMSDTAVVVVLPPQPVAFLRIEPIRWTMLVGDSLQLEVILLDTLGTLLTDRAVAWTSITDDAAAPVSDSGLVRGVAEGDYLIEARSEGIADTVEITVLAGPLTFAMVTKASSIACAVTTTALVYCWGRVGAPSSVFGRLFVDELFVPTPWNAGAPLITLDGWSGCGILTDQQPVCWPYGAPDSTPQVVPGNLHVTQIARAAGAEVCGLTIDGSVYCWSTDGGTVSTPRRVGGSHQYTDLATASYTSHSCAIAADGTAYCWGNNAVGQLGNGTTTDVPESLPTAVSGGHTFVALTLGDHHSCGVDDQGQAYCWGGNEQGQLGIGTDTIASTTVPMPVVGGIQFSSHPMTSDRWRSCGIDQDGGVYCWGARGQWLPLPYVHGDTPQRLQGNVTFSRISVHSHGLCGMATDGRVYCAWNPPLGDGTSNGNAVPQLVELQQPQ